ncbi:MAG: hypothetical protein PHH00_00940 [Candidatus Nanoarchaeia archaeon]|nr:hypothetical protein [Candidatus Nanoarchaeia archaeon]
MKKDFFCNAKNSGIPEDIMNEIIVLYSIGVSIEDLKYLLSVRMNGD